MCVPECIRHVRGAWWYFLGLVADLLGNDPHTLLPVPNATRRHMQIGLWYVILAQGLALKKNMKGKTNVSREFLTFMKTWSRLVIRTGWRCWPASFVISFTCSYSQKRRASCCHSFHSFNSHVVAAATQQPCNHSNLLLLGYGECGRD